MLRHISRIANEASAGEATWKSPVPAPSQGVDPDGPAQSLHRVAQAIDGSLEVVQDAVDGPSDDRLEQVLLRAHVVVQARGADAQASGDLADGRRGGRGTGMLQ